MDKIIFKKIKNNNIFNDSYENFTKHNEIDFSSKGIAIIYGPNGSGKTSFAKVLSGEENTFVEYIYNNQENKFTSDFHIINDQNNRNIIGSQENNGIKEFFWVIILQKNTSY